MYVIITSIGKTCSSGRDKADIHAGFTLIEATYGLFVLSIIAVLLTPLCHSLNQLARQKEKYYQDEVSVYQLQIELAVNDIKSVAPTYIRYRTVSNDCILHIVNEKLISQPGTLDFIHGISKVKFYLEENIIYVSYKRNNQQFNWPIGYYCP